ncbi:hypothetical protein [Ferrimonas balearica]|uniref:hypothetical protein n=1 Tax=Ferrimonas balearica TaxID=44012 RepID=UPI001C99A938|nr:hypothetical protein [Ferrimonas balearica]MBY5923019.1 hypothetical protein [Ferrimonas balearica]MBY5997604.1 hypothetical protein [Ferrimonas balearica]
MSVTTMVVVIVAIVMGCVLEISRHWARSGGKRRDKETEAALTRLREENSKLAERVATLEAIVTDRGFDLDQAIRKLG